MDAGLKDDLRFSGICGNIAKRKQRMVCNIAHCLKAYA